MSSHKRYNRRGEDVHQRHARIANPDDHVYDARVQGDLHVRELLPRFSPTAIWSTSTTSSNPGIMGGPPTTTTSTTPDGELSYFLINWRRAIRSIYSVGTPNICGTFIWGPNRVNRTYGYAGVCTTYTRASILGRQFHYGLFARPSLCIIGGHSSVPDAFYL